MSSDPVIRLLAAAARAPHTVADDSMPHNFDADLLRKLRNSEDREPCFVLPVFRHAFAWACAVVLLTGLLSGYHFWNAPDAEDQAIDEAIIAASAIELSLVP